MGVGRRDQFRDLGIGRDSSEAGAVWRQGWGPSNGASTVTPALRSASINVVRANWVGTWSDVGLLMSSWFIHDERFGRTC